MLLADEQKMKDHLDKVVKESENKDCISCEKAEYMAVSKGIDKSVQTLNCGICDTEI